jgi:hypothetical protein
VLVASLFLVLLCCKLHDDFTAGKIVIRIRR